VAEDAEPQKLIASGQGHRGRARTPSG
jgi:hypothetical protein